MQFTLHIGTLSRGVVNKSHWFEEFLQIRWDFFMGAICSVQAKKTAPLGINSNTPAKVEYCQKAARKARFHLTNVAGMLRPKSGVAFCMKSKINKHVGVSVLYNGSVACLGNVRRCGSVWNCAVCAAKISEVRRKELASGIENHKLDGGFVYLLTLTNSHSREDQLKPMLDGQRKALQGFLSGTRATKHIFERFGKIGHVKALELTYSQQNGWHPHYHFLLFTPKNLNAVELQSFRDELAEQWIKCCKRACLPLPSFERGVDLRDGSYADRYVGKWGVDYELTKAHIKQGINGSLTPFDILKLAESSRQHAALFIEFSKAFHGARQLGWSRGLKKMLGISVDKSDQEIVDQTNKDSEVVLTLSDAEFYALKNLEKVADFLAVVEKDCSQNLNGIEIRSFLNSALFEYLERLRAYSSDPPQISYSSAIQVDALPCLLIA